jgi:hypothetical protein
MVGSFKYFCFAVIEVLAANLCRNFNGSNLVRFFFMLVLPGTLFTLSAINEMVGDFQMFALIYIDIFLFVENQGPTN